MTHEMQQTRHSGMRTRYNDVIQHVIAQSAVAIFGPFRAVAALAHELSARFLAQGNKRRGGSNSCLIIVRPALTERANWPPAKVMIATQ